MSRKPVKISAVNVDALFGRIRLIWESMQVQAARSVNTAHVCANWLIGREIVEEEQAGKARATYGSEQLQVLSTRLSKEYGSGFSLTALKYMRLFYLNYPALIEIGHAVRDESDNLFTSNELQIGHALRDHLAAADANSWKPGKLHSGLSWTHYRTLLKVERREVRDFYEIEAIKNSWSARALERQINSLLYERLLKSRDKDGVIALANEGLVVSRPRDAIKDPYVLEFLDLPESERLLESQVETALLNKLQAFLLELGNGFAFVGRQQRLTLDGDHFYPDLVFYHIQLRCYVIIDLKVNKLNHGDLGQMLMYVNYYDREVVRDDDNPTIGLILCTDKNDTMAQYVLDEKNEQIFASRYKTWLPTEEELRNELQREIDLTLPEGGGI